MAGVGFLQSLWEKPIWEGVWPYLNPMDSACVRTASTVWNVPGKYWPHGELFFFLIQKEPAKVPDRDTLSSPSSMLTSVPPPSPFSSDLLKKCALVALHVMAEEGSRAPGLGTNGKWAAQKVHCGRVKANRGRKTKVCLLVALERGVARHGVVWAW